jgi:2-amino-4-hydroxy-6-hydroxymethyldihydropteridine diphosphokinase
LNAARENEAFPVYLGLGSNIEPEKHLPEAVDLLAQHLRVGDRSSVWESPPVGGPGPNFLNAVMLLFTHLEPDTLREQLLRPVEDALGRVRSSDPNAPRTIDLDILVFDGQVLEPEIWEQAHWSVPLAELVPDCANPETGETVGEAARRLSQAIPISRREDVWLHGI